MTAALHNRSSGFNRSALAVIAITAFLITAVTMIFQPGTANATTMAGTSVTNTVTVTYRSAAGTATYTAQGSVTVTVALQYSAPAVAFVSQNPVATSGSPTDESTLVTQTYGIHATNNGPVQYTVNSPTYTPTSIGAASVGTLPTPFWLGATTVAYTAASGQAVILVPYDGTANSTIGGANGITTSSQLWINGAAVSISAIAEDTTGDATVPLELRGRVSKITLASNLTVALTPGTQIGEYKTFAVPVTTGTFTAAPYAGSYAGSLTVQDSASNVSTAATSSIYVERANLTVLKEVSIDGTTWTGNTTQTPARNLWYRITVTNPSTTKTVNTVSLQDALSAYTAFRVGSITFTASTSGLTYPASATTTYLDQANAVYTPVSTGGGAPANYDALVSSFTIAFTGQTMAVNSNFQFIYQAWLY